jgi:hypothetical protein
MGGHEGGAGCTVQEKVVEAEVVPSVTVTMLL